jgi:hypothetical protein
MLDEDQCWRICDAHDADLLPTVVPGSPAAPKRDLLPDRGGGAASWLPGMQALSPRRRTRITGVEPTQ